MKCWNNLGEIGGTEDIIDVLGHVLGFREQGVLRRGRQLMCLIQNHHLTLGRSNGHIPHTLNERSYIVNTILIGRIHFLDIILFVFGPHLLRNVKGILLFGSHLKGERKNPCECRLACSNRTMDNVEVRNTTHLKLVFESLDKLLLAYTLLE